MGMGYREEEEEVIEDCITAEKECGERGTVEMKKHKVCELGGGEKSKKNKENEISDKGICENEFGGLDGVIKGGRSAEKECGERGNIEMKKHKVCGLYADKNSKKDKKNVVSHNGICENECGRREEDESIGSDFHVQEQDFEDTKCGRQTSVDGTCGSELQNGKGVKELGESSSGDVASMVDKKRMKKMKKKREMIEVESDASQQVDTYLSGNDPKEKMNQRGEGVKLEAFAKHCDVDSIQRRERKKRKREKKNENDVLGATGHGIPAEEHMKGNANSTMNEKLDRDLKKRRKGKKKMAKFVDNSSEDPKPKESKKRGRFSGSVEVLPPSDDKLVWGKRFSKEEDEIVKEAVYKYIEAHSLGEEGLNMVLNCKSYPEIKNCWKEITTCLPNRPRSSVYYRAQILFRRDEKRKWTEEEIELVRNFQEKHGNQWKVLADELGKHRFHVKDTWRRIRHKNLKKGCWSQEEYQTLFDLVNTDLIMKYSEEKKSKHGMLRDNIAWTAISDKLSTRSDANCCLKWYYQLTSSMVAEGVWADADDYRLIDVLFQLDACCTEDVDWDNLIEHRSGDVCRKRWNQMVLHIGDNRNKSFADQVEVLAKRYCPDLLEARETWDSKAVVP